MVRVRFRVNTTKNLNSNFYRSTQNSLFEESHWVKFPGPKKHATRPVGVIFFRGTHLVS